MVNVTGRYIASPSTLSDGQQQDIRFAADGSLIVALAGASGTSSGVSPLGSLSVSTDATSSFTDPFDGATVDTTDRWTTQLSTGTVTQTGGQMTVNSSTTASAYAGIYTKATFAPNIVAPQVVGFNISIESPVKANVKRFWGLGTLPGTPTVAIPITDGFGFELTEAGVFRAVLYSAGAVVTTQTLTAPTSAAVAGYAIAYRGDVILFYAGGTTPVAAFSYTLPATQSLPMVMLAVNGTTPPSSGQAMIVQSAAVGDYGKNTNQISDGSFPWRKATVKAASTAAAATDSPLVVALHPSSPMIPGVSATNLGKAEDAASASGDTGVFMLGVRRDTLTTSASATGDYNEMAVGPYGDNIIRSYEKHAKTYSASANIAAAASATDIAILPGNATTTVYVTKVIITGVQTTAGLADIQLVKRSTANSGGTSTAMTSVPHDSTDAAASSAPLAYTANPTPGTAVGSVRRGYQPIAGATSVVNPLVVYDFGDKGRPIILRGTAQGLAVNLNGVTLTGGTFDIVYEWFEI